MVGCVPYEYMIQHWSSNIIISSITQTSPCTLVITYQMNSGVFHCVGQVNLVSPTNCMHLIFFLYPIVVFGNLLLFWQFAFMSLCWIFFALLYLCHFCISKIIPRICLFGFKQSKLNFMRKNVRGKIFPKNFKNKIKKVFNIFGRVKVKVPTVGPKSSHRWARRLQPPLNKR